MSTTNILDLNNRLDALEKNSGGGGSADSAKRSDIATEFNTTTSYTAGCFVYHDGKLYQFNADHSAGAWDPTDVVEANVTDQIVSNKSAIDGLTASDVAYDNTASGLTATDVQGAVDEVVANMGNMRMAKLWENQNPSSTFAAQTIAVDVSDYQFIGIFSDGMMTVIRVGGGRTAIYREGYSNNNLILFRRVFNADGANGIVIEDGSTNTQGQGSTTDNTKNIPTLIYGIKLT